MEIANMFGSVIVPISWIILTHCIAFLFR